MRGREKMLLPATLSRAADDARPWRKWTAGKRMPHPFGMKALKLPNGCGLLSPATVTGPSPRARTRGEHRRPTELDLFIMRDGVSYIDMRGLAVLGSFHELNRRITVT
jgi:hypothetical protein